jgi:hypothetical protein
MSNLIALPDLSPLSMSRTLKLRFFASCLQALWAREKLPESLPPRLQSMLASLLRRS